MRTEHERTLQHHRYNVVGCAHGIASILEQRTLFVEIFGGKKGKKLLRVKQCYMCFIKYVRKKVEGDRFQKYTGMGRVSRAPPSWERAAGARSGRRSLLLRRGAAASGPARRLLPDGADLEAAPPGAGKSSVRLAAVLRAVPDETASAAFPSGGPALWAS